MSDTTTPTVGDWVPEFEGQRAPFERGNEAAVKSGAFSPKKVDEEVEKAGHDLLDRYPALAEHPETYNAIRRVRAMTNLLFRDVMERPRDKRGEVRSSTIARYFTAENTFAKLRESAGMTPAAEIAIARERADAMRSVVDLHALAARGQAALDARASEPDLVLTTETDREGNHA